jgi:hypothetical protein
MYERISELSIHYSGPDLDDAETEKGLLETLSVLSTLNKTAFPPLQQIWNDLVAPIAIELPTEQSNLWLAGSSLVGTLVNRLSPFDVHLSASQALIFSEDANTDFPAVCLLLCSWSLRQCPAKLKRWKRWQSMLCSTVRLFQEYHNPNWEIQLWIHYLLPSFEFVTLPPEALHVGIAAGLVGTTLELIANHPHDDDNETLQCRHAIEKAMMTQNHEVLSHPWTVSSFRKLQCEEDHSFELHKQDLAWWTECANGHDSVSSMVTSWSAKGLARLAWDCWKKPSSLTSTPEKKWNDFFPHVPNLLVEDDHSHAGLELLQHLLSILPSQSLVEWQAVPTNPIGTIQLLCNHLVLASQQRRRESQQLQQKQFAIGVLSANLMQSLVERYVPVSQVEMIDHLLQDCPYPGLQPKLLDLLRPLVRDSSCCPELWSLVQTRYLQDMLEQHVTTGQNARRQQVSGLNDLLDKVEIYVSATSLVELHWMLWGSWPIGVEVSTFDTMLKAISSTTAEQTNDDERPPEFHRLFLLQSTLEQVVEHSKSAYCTSCNK